jgi:DNA modification methylase
LTAVFREVKRILRHDGTLWLNISDTYCGTGNKGDHHDPKYPNGRTGQQISLNHRAKGCKAKDLIGIPWLLAFALRADGWFLRNDIIWVKANPMPESAKDRCSRCYEHVFLLAKAKKYYFDASAIAEPIAPTTAKRLKAGRGEGNKYAAGLPGQTAQKINQGRKPGSLTDAEISPFRNRRDVWHINTVPYAEAHFAAFPPKLAETCILAGCPPDGVVLDPFMGSGTTGFSALQSGRKYLGIDINAEYCRLARERIGGVKP